jgi:hypothetical protein
MAMDSHESNPTNPSFKAESGPWAQALYDIETYFRQKGVSEFVYDAKLDVFRFPEDGQFAFCEEFADWTLLEERGYLDF